MTPEEFLLSFIVDAPDNGGLNPLLEEELDEMAIDFTDMIGVADDMVSSMLLERIDEMSLSGKERQAALRYLEEVHGIYIG